MDIVNCVKGGLPPIFPRSSVGELTGGIIHPKTLANLDSAGKGPSKRWRVGQRVFYERDSFIEWFASRVQLPERKDPKSNDQVPKTRSAEVLGYLADSFEAH